MLHRLLNHSGRWLVIILSLIPLLFWLPHSVFGNIPATWLSIGQLTAILGYSLYCPNFVLSARLKFLEPLFSGLNRIYIFHHQVGATALVLLLFHPLSITFSYLYISLSAAANLLIPNPTNLPVFFGSLALFITIILLVLTLYVKLEYDLWKLTHKFLGLALFFASLHVFFIGSTLAVSPQLKAYLLVLTISALISYGYRTLFPRLLVRQKSYTVTSVVPLNSHILEIELAPTDSHTLNFAPGQFVFMTPLVPGILHQSHPFSPVSSPHSPKLTLALKKVGNFTTSLALLKPGSIVKVEGPFGRFSYTYFFYPHQLWIAGGIGITPFVSLARSLASYPQISRVDLFYSVKDPSDAVYHKELSSLSKSRSNFNFHLHSSNTHGKLTIEKILSELPDLTNREIFICGPAAMMSSLKTQLKSHRVRSSHIHTEEFSLY